MAGFLLSWMNYKLLASNTKQIIINEFYRKRVERLNIFQLTKTIIFELFSGGLTLNGYRPRSRNDRFGRRIKN